MERTSLDAGQDGGAAMAPDDVADDLLVEMANLDQQDTDVPGTIFVSTALGSRGPRVTWYPGRAGRDLPCRSKSIPEVRETFLSAAVARSAAPRRAARHRMGRLNQAALLDFRTDGTSWNRREVSAFLEHLQMLP